MATGKALGSIVSIADSSGGTASDTIADLSGESAAVQNAIASLAAKQEEILAALRKRGELNQ